MTWEQRSRSADASRKARSLANLPLELLMTMTSGHTAPNALHGVRPPDTTSLKALNVPASPTEDTWGMLYQCHLTKGAVRLPQSYLKVSWWFWEKRF